MRCAKCQKLYDDAVRGLLSERLDRKIREHVAFCPTCAVVWQENESLRRLVRESSQPARIPDSAAFARMARHAVAQVEIERAEMPAARGSWLEGVAGWLRGRQLKTAGLVQAVAQLETNWKDHLDIDVFIPVSTKVPGKTIDRVKGCGVTGLGDFKF